MENKLANAQEIHVHQKELSITVTPNQLEEVGNRRERKIFPKNNLPER